MYTSQSKKVLAKILSSWFYVILMATGQGFPHRSKQVPESLDYHRKKLAHCRNVEAAVNDSQNKPQILFLFPHLYTQDVCSGFDELIRQFQIVVQGVLLPHWVRDVACVRDGSLNDAACCSGSFHSQQHVWQVVQGIKHTEDVHAILLGHLAEPAGGEGGRGKLCQDLLYTAM